MPFFDDAAVNKAGATCTCVLYKTKTSTAVESPGGLHEEVLVDWDHRKLRRVWSNVPDYSKLALVEKYSNIFADFFFFLNHTNLSLKCRLVR